MYTNSIVLIFILLIASYSYRKRINLLLVKWKYGEYSFNYLTLFKSYFSSNPHPYCFKDELLQHISNLKKSVVTAKGPVVHFDTKLVLPQKLTSDKLIEEQGIPGCFNAYRDSNYDLKLIGYPNDKFAIKSKIVYYFYENTLFALDYVFEDFTQSKIDAVIANIAQVLELPIGNEKSATYILEHNGRLLLTNTGFRISLKFYAADNETFLKVISVFDKQQTEMKSQIENQFFTSVSA